MSNTTKAQVNVTMAPETAAKMRELADRLSRVPIERKGPGDYTYTTRVNYSYGDVVAMAIERMYADLDDKIPPVLGTRDGTGNR